MQKKNKVCICPNCKEVFTFEVVKKQAKSLQNGKYTFYCSDKCKEKYVAKMRKQKQLFGG